MSTRPRTALPPAFLDRQDVTAALRTHDFGAVFALAHQLVPLSYAQISEACGIKPDRVGLLARGQGRISSFDKIAAVVDALHIPGHMVGLAPRPWEPTGEPVRRRDFLTASTGAGLAVALPALTPPRAGRRLDPKTPGRLRERAARLRRLDDVLGGGDTHRVYLGEYQATKRLIRESEYSENTGRALLSVLSEQAQQAGWAAFDAGRHDDARSLYEDSHQAATDAVAPELAGNALAFLAYQQDDPRAAETIAVQSCRTAGTDAPPAVRALLYERRAWAHATAGDPAATERALDAATAALSEPPSAPQPDWATWVDHTELTIMTGRCWTELGRPLRAATALEQALAEFSDDHARDKALYMCWLAASYLAAGEVEQAAATASRVLALSTGVASVRPRQRLEPVLVRLRPHRHVGEVADVLELARASQGAVVDPTHRR